MDHSTSDELTSLSKTSSLSDEFGSINHSFSSSRRFQKVSGPKSRSGSSYKGNARVQELSINKLRYDCISFVGREAESEILRSRLRRVATTSGEEEKERRKELVFIRGWSGAGKSSLSNRLQDWTNELDKGLFVTGKFELTSKTPYSGIAQAIGKVCLEAKQQIGGSNLRVRLVSELGSDVQLIKTLIPELRQMLYKEKEEDISVHDENGFEASMERWKNIFRALVRILGSYFSPLVIALDDLQWADVASLSVLDFLLTDSQNMNGLFVVCCYRSNEVDDAHVLSKTISILSDKTEKGLFNLTEIELGNLSLEDTNKIIMAMLDIDDEGKTKGLAEICFKRTLGNPFFLIQFVTMLEADGLISFSLGLLRWEWRVQAVEESTMSTKNVVKMLQDRMRKLPEDHQLLLQYAANLGASFHHGLVEPVWLFHSSNNTADKEKSDLQSMYGALASNLYIERSQGNRFHWVHDKIQEAALQLGEASNPAFQFEIGSILLERLGNDDLEQSLFDVVNLVNKGSIDDPSRRIAFCKLNLKAAEKAQSFSAFDSASRYVTAGIKLLPTDKWESPHRQLTLRLYAIGAEMALASGNVEKMDYYSDKVLFREDCTTVEKLPLYLTLTYKQATMDLEYERATELCFAVLKDLGCPVARNGMVAAVQALRALTRIVRTARKEKRDYAQTLPLMTDERQKAIMTFLNRSLYASLMTQRAATGMAIATQMYDITLEHGISAEAGPTFATLSMVVIPALNDYDTAAFFAETAIKAQQKSGSKYNEASTLYIAGFGAMTWRRPLQDCSNLMLEAYSVGMKSGNTVYGIWGLLMHCIIFPFVLGKPLGPILTAGTQNIPFIEEARQEEQIKSSRLFCQTIANLVGKSEETTLLQGHYFASVGWKPTLQLEADFNFLRMALSIYFGDYEAAAEIALGPGDSFEKKMSGCFMTPPEIFLRGVAVFAVARKTKRWRQKRAAHQILATVERWLQYGNPNVKAYHCVLQAEQAAIRNNHKDAESFYKEAVITAARTGQLHVAGLASERFADFLQTEKKDLEESLYQKEQAIRFYSEWGANAVVERIQSSMAFPKAPEIWCKTI